MTIAVTMAVTMAMLEIVMGAKEPVQQRMRNRSLWTKALKEKEKRLAAWETPAMRMGMRHYQMELGMQHWHMRLLS
jgi:hypothetical protein